MARVNSGTIFALHSDKDPHLLNPREFIWDLALGLVLPHIYQRTLHLKTMRFSVRNRIQCILDFCRVRRVERENRLHRPAEVRDQDQGEINQNVRQHQPFAGNGWKVSQSWFDENFSNCHCHMFCFTGYRFLPTSSSKAKHQHKVCEVCDRVGTASHRFWDEWQRLQEGIWEHVKVQGGLLKLQSCYLSWSFWYCLFSL